MFHLFKRAYLEFDYKLDNVGYNFVIATDLFHGLPMGGSVAPTCVLPAASAFDNFLTHNFQGDVENFWQFMYSADRKIIGYFKTQVVEQLLIQYIKSVFEFGNVQDHYLLYTSIVESVRVRSHIQATAPDLRNKMTRELFLLKSFEQFKTLYDAQPVSNFLRNVINKQTVSFEYLLPDYLLHGDKSLVRDEILKRVKYISIDNWRDEIEQLRLETMFGFLDMSALDPSSNFEVGNVEAQLQASKTLRWMVDENFSADPEYITSNYDYADMVDQWHALERFWIVNRPGSDTVIEDMFEVNKLIMAQEWETLLHRDINRGFGCLYTFELYREKSNQIFSVYCYRKKRQNTVEDLAPFRLY